MTQVDIFNEKRENDWVIFHDESFCEQTNFLYHGFLFIKKEVGKNFLNKINKPYPDNYERRVHFTDLRGLSSRRSKIAMAWLKKFKTNWARKDNIKFYCLGINLSNINYDLYKESSKFVKLPKKEDRVYKKFYEIGLKGSLAWFKIDMKYVTHLFFDQGKQDVDRFNKSINIVGKNTIIKPIHNNKAKSQTDLSKILQLNDVILGSVRKSFAPPPKSNRVQAKCVDIMEDLVEQFSDRNKAYRTNSDYFRNFCISFFPSNNNMTPKEFFNQGIEYHRKSKDLFYCDRKTYKQKIATQKQKKLF